MNITELSQKLRDFRKESEAQKEINRTDKALVNLKKFVNRYPFREKPTEIQNLKPKEIFNPNQGDKDYFFYWIQYPLKALGHIFVGHAGWFENARDNSELFKKLLEILVDENKSIAEKLDAPWEEIKGFGGDKNLAKKILFCYYSEKLFPIYKTEDLEDFMRKFNLPFLKKSESKYNGRYEVLTVGQRFELLQYMLSNLKKSIPESENMSKSIFSAVLYYYYPVSRMIREGKRVH